MFWCSVSLLFSCLNKRCTPLQATCQQAHVHGTTAQQSKGVGPACSNCRPLGWLMQLLTCCCCYAEVASTALIIQEACSSSCCCCMFFKHGQAQAGALLTDCRLTDHVQLTIRLIRYTGSSHSSWNTPASSCCQAAMVAGPYVGVAYCCSSQSMAGCVTRLNSSKLCEDAARRRQSQ